MCVSREQRDREINVLAVQYLFDESMRNISPIWYSNLSWGSKVVNSVKVFLLFVKMASVNMANDESFNFSSDSELRDCVKMEELEGQTQYDTFMKKEPKGKCLKPMRGEESINRTLKQEKDDEPTLGSDLWLRDNFEFEGEDSKETLLTDVKTENNSEHVQAKGKRKSKSKESENTYMGRKNCLVKSVEKEDSDIKRREMLKDAVISNRVDNLCRHKCPCGKIFIQRQRIVQHLRKTNHGTTKDADIKYLIKVVHHECKICSKKILCDTNRIKAHVVKCHKIKSLHEYINMTKAEVKEHQKQFLDDHNNFRIRSIVYDEQSDLLGNLCIYRCNKCDKEFSSKAVLREHLSPGLKKTSISI